MGSRWKGTFVDPAVYNSKTGQVHKWKFSEVGKRLIRRGALPQNAAGALIQVHNGRRWVRLEPYLRHVGLKAGALAHKTRTAALHLSKKKKHKKKK